MDESEKKEIPRRKPVGAEDAPTGAQIQRMVQECKKRGKLKQELLIIVGWMLALRISAIAGLKVGDFDFFKDTVKVRKELQKNTKKTKRKDRFIVMNEAEYVFRIKEYKNHFGLLDSDFLFCHGDDRKPYTTRRLAYMIERVGEWIGFDGLHPHLLRHSRAKWLIEKGYSLRFVQELLLHQHASTTLNEYSRFDIEALRAQGEVGKKLTGK